MHRKPFTLLAITAIAITGMTATGTTATAAEPSTRTPDTSIVADDDTLRLNQLSDVKAYADGRPVDGFDPTRDGAYTIPAGATPRLTNLPSGWTPAMSVVQDGKQTVRLTRNTTTVTYTFTYDGSDDATIRQLKDVTASVDGRPVDGFDPTASRTYMIPEGKTVTIQGVPDTWNTRHKRGSGVWTLTNPDTTTTVTYTFHEKNHRSGLRDLANLTVHYPTGSRVKGFDPMKPGGHRIIGDITSLTFTGLPGDWTYAPLSTRMGWTFTSPDGKTKATYTFTPETPAKTMHTVVFDPDGGTGDYGQVSVEDGKPVTKPADPTPKDDAHAHIRFEGWHYQNQPWDFSQPVTQDMTLTAGWSAVGDGPTILRGDVNNDGKYTIDDLKDITAKNDGQPVTGFNYRKTDYQVDTLDATLENLPDGWTFKVLGTASRPGPATTPQLETISVYAPDGTPAAAYRFTLNGTTTPTQPSTKPSDVNGDGKYTVDDLKDLTVDNDGKPYAGFDYKTTDYQVDGTLEPQLKNLPEGWGVEMLIEPYATGQKTDRMVRLTLVAPDKTTIISYRFTQKKTDDATPNGKGDVSGDSQYTTDDLTGTTVDGVIGFNPSKPGPYRTGDPTSVTVGNLPDGWKQTSDGHGNLLITSPNGNPVIAYRFTKPDDATGDKDDPDKGDDGTPTTNQPDTDKPSTGDGQNSGNHTDGRYTLDSLKHLTASMNGHPITVFDYRTNQYQVSDPHDVQLDGTPEGWKQTIMMEATSATMTISPYKKFTLTSSDGTYTATYTFTMRPTGKGETTTGRKASTAAIDGMARTGSNIHAAIIVGVMSTVVGVTLSMLARRRRSPKDAR